MAISAKRRAQNPNTPPEELVLLMGKHADVVLQNPAFALLLVEQPDLWSQVVADEAAALAVAALPAVPVEFVLYVLRHPAQHLVPPLLRNAAVPLSLRQQLFFLDAPGGLLPEAEWPALVGTELASLARRLGLRASSAHLTPDATLTEVELEQLGLLGQLGTRQALAHPGCPVSVIDRALQSSDVTLRFAAAAHPRLPDDRLEQLTVDPELHVRRTVALHPRLGEAGLRRLLGDANEIRYRIAQRALLPDAIAVALASDPEIAPRRVLAGRPGLPLAAATLLAADPAPGVRAALAANAALPEALALTLARDADAAVRLAVSRRKALADDALAVLVRDADARVRFELARKPALPAAVVAALAADEDEQIRGVVARRVDAGELALP
jgi:hypothetical protein